MVDPESEGKRGKVIGFYVLLFVFALNNFIFNAVWLVLYLELLTALQIHLLDARLLIVGLDEQVHKPA